jgi:hypothetical protein
MEGGGWRWNVDAVAGQMAGGPRVEALYSQPSLPRPLVTLSPSGSSVTPLQTLSRSAQRRRRRRRRRRKRRRLVSPAPISSFLLLLSPSSCSCSFLVFLLLPA